MDSVQPQSCVHFAGRSLDGLPGRLKRGKVGNCMVLKRGTSASRQEPVSLGFTRLGLLRTEPSADNT